MIDAFVAEPYGGYGSLAGEALAALEGGSGAFASLDVALTSHHHRDHFQAEPARRLLAARPEVLFATSPQRGGAATKRRSPSHGSAAQLSALSGQHSAPDCRPPGTAGNVVARAWEGASDS